MIERNRFPDLSPKVWLLGFLLIFLFGSSTDAAIRINSITCSKSSVSKGQTGIQVFMEVENTGLLTVSLFDAYLTFDVGSYQQTRNSPPTGANILAGSKETCVFTVSVNPMSDSGLCVVNGHIDVDESGTLLRFTDDSADVTHSWTVQTPSELVINTISGASEVSRGSIGNRVIMDIGRSGESGITLEAANLLPLVPANYTLINFLSPALPQTFTKNYWWNNKWKYRRQLSIMNRSLSTLPAGYEIELAFDHASLLTAGKALQPNGNDMRIVFDNGTTYVDTHRFMGQGPPRNPGQ